MMTKMTVIAITHQRGLDVDRMTGVNPSRKRRQVLPRFTMLNKALWKSKNERRERIRDETSDRSYEKAVFASDALSFASLSLTLR